MNDDDLQAHHLRAQQSSVNNISQPSSENVQIQKGASCQCAAASASAFGKYFQGAAVKRCAHPPVHCHVDSVGQHIRCSTGVCADLVQAVQRAFQVALCSHACIAVGVARTMRLEAATALSGALPAGATIVQQPSTWCSSTQQTTAWRPSATSTHPTTSSDHHGAFWAGHRIAAKRVGRDVDLGDRTGLHAEAACKPKSG
jgi:hypothetical protein